MEELAVNVLKLSTNNIKCDGNNAKIYDSYCIGYETSNNKTTYSYLYIVCPYMGILNYNRSLLPNYPAIFHSCTQLSALQQTEVDSFALSVQNSSLGVSVTSLGS